MPVEYKETNIHSCMRTLLSILEVTCLFKKTQQTRYILTYMNKKLTTREEVVDYVKKIIKLGDKERIKRVMERYLEYVMMEERSKMKEEEETQIKTAKRIFEVN
jgi:uncharacterized protein YehS (DUF1456 family)